MLAGRICINTFVSVDILRLICRVKAGGRIESTHAAVSITTLTMETGTEEPVCGSFIIPNKTPNKSPTADYTGVLNGEY